MLHFNGKYGVCDISFELIVHDDGDIVIVARGNCGIFYESKQVYHLSYNLGDDLLDNVELSYCVLNDYWSGQHNENVRELFRDLIGD